MPEAAEKPEYYDKLIGALVVSEGVTVDSIVENTRDTRLNKIGDVVRILKGKAEQVLIGMGLPADEAEEEARRLDELMKKVDEIRGKHITEINLPKLLNAMNSLESIRVSNWLREAIPLSEYARSPAERWIQSEEYGIYREATTKDIHIAKLEVRNGVANLLGDLIKAPVIPANLYDYLGEVEDEHHPALDGCYENCISLVRSNAVLSANRDIESAGKMKDNEGKAMFIQEVLANCERAEEDEE